MNEAIEDLSKLHAFGFIIIINGRNPQSVIFVTFVLSLTHYYLKNVFFSDN